MVRRIVPLLSCSVALGGCASLLGLDDWSGSGGGAGVGGTTSSTGGTTSSTGGAPSCDDGVKNGLEADVDCGADCPSCPEGASCTTDADCATGHCAAGTCCTDACGGTCFACSQAQTQRPDGTCAPAVAGTDPSDDCTGADTCDGHAHCGCDNGVKDGAEQGVDCGGPCGGCIASCNDGSKSGDETDIDCGGNICPKCVDGKTCAAGSDCVGGACTSGLCCTPELPSVTCSKGCGDSVPNNCGQLVDCQSLCVPGVPVGWSGPVAFGTGASAPTCSGTWGTKDLTAGVTIDAPPATCTPACTCSVPAGGVCGVPVLTVYGTPGCTSQVFQGPVRDAVCGTVSASGESAAVSTLVTTPGACNAAMVSATTQPAAFSLSGTVCSGPSGTSGCGGDMCVPAPLAGLQGGCVYSAGDVACPSPFTSKNLLFAGISDQRGCSPCKCNPPVGVLCTGIVTVYGDGSCTSAVGTGTADGSCLSFGSAFLQSELVTTVPSGGVCAHAGGDPIGQAVGTTPTTVCCVP